MSEELEKRKEEVLKFLNTKKKWVYTLILAAILYLGAFIRTRNIPLTKWKYPLALDPYVVLRYSEYYLNHGKLMALDLMRSYPLGFNPQKEFTFISAFIANLHKVLSIFVKNLTITQTDIIYPVICFIIGMIFFYLVIKQLFNSRTALLSTAFLAVVPPYLYRTMAGFSDKEPLAMMFLFMAFYFFILAYKSKKETKNLLFGGLAGITTAFAALVWGGALYIFLIIGLFGFIEVILRRFTKQDLYSYGAWMITLTLILITMSNGRFNLKSLMVSFSTGIVYVVFFIALIYYALMEKDLLKIRDKVTKKMPRSVFSTLAGLITIIVLTSIFFGPGFIIGQIKEVTSTMIHPLKDRWALTVAESHQPYIKDWFSQMGKTYVWAFIIGSILMFYQAVKKLKKDKYWLTAGYALFTFSIIFSRYSAESRILNGISKTAQFMYLGSIVIFGVILLTYYLTNFYKNKEKFKKIVNINKKYVFALSWFLIMLMSARSAIRLIFVFSTATAVMTGYLGMKMMDSSLKIKDKLFKYAFLIIISVLILTTFVGFAKASISNAKYTGPSYNQQWQSAGDWVRGNVKEDAVFAHWWDYGYWVQGGFGRATITDGGNVIGPWNHFMGRHVITAQSETEALEFLKSHNATHLLMISDEIGKYPAFSSIGSDENYDRYSWINTFNMDETRTQETRNSTMYLYTGGTLLDEDFIYGDKIFPRQSAGIIAFIIVTQKIEVEGISAEPITEAKAVLVYNEEQTIIPLECVFIQGKEAILPEKGLPGCLRIVPNIESQTKINSIGSALYLSPKVRRTLFTKLYLYGASSPNFRVVYNDENMMPLSIYQGRMIGPIKIWEISYPQYIKPNEIYLRSTYPNINVTRI